MLAFVTTQKLSNIIIEHDNQNLPKDYKLRLTNNIQEISRCLPTKHVQQSLQIV